MLDLFGKKKKEIELLNKIIAKLSFMLIQKGMSPATVQQAVEDTRKKELLNEKD